MAGMHTSGKQHTLPPKGSGGAHEAHAAALHDGAGRPQKENAPPSTGAGEGSKAQGPVPGSMSSAPTMKAHDCK